MAFLRGDIVLVPFPFTNLTTSKVRPALVLSGALYQGSEPVLILGAITSNLRAATGPFDYVFHDWKAAGLQLPSAFKAVLATIERRRIIHSIGSLTIDDLMQVERHLRRMFEL